MAGLDENGLSIKRLQDVRAEITARLEAFFGDDINTDEDSVFGQIRDSVAPGESSLWEQVQIVYDSQSPNRAEGQQLDDNCSLVGVFRDSNVKTTTTSLVTGLNNTVIPLGFNIAVNTTQDEFENISQTSLSGADSVNTLISIDVVADSTLYTISIEGIDNEFTSDGSATDVEIVAGLIAAITANISDVTSTTTVNTNEIFITSDVILDSKQVLLDTNMSYVSVATPVNMIAKEFGPILAPINQLIDIKTFIAGVTSAINPEEAVVGTIRESDAELRIKRDNTLSQTGSTSVEAINSRINNLDNIRSVTVLENFTDNVDGLGLTPHSIKAVVEGGDDTEIAQAIFDSKPAGTDMNGSVSVPIEDSQGLSRNILFERPTIKTIFIIVNLTKFADYPSDGDNIIKGNLVQFGVDNLFAGDDVIVSRLYQPVNAVQGHQIDSLFIGLSPAPTLSTTIPIDSFELADIEAINITVN